MNKYVKKTILYCAIALILGIVLGLLSELVRHPRGEPVTITVTDTITLYKPIEVRDTFIREVPAKVRIVRIKGDTVYVPMDPKVIEQRNDSAEAVIPITQKEYADSDYRAWVSGYMPSLDSIRIYRRTILPPDNPQPSLHFTLGVGAVYSGKLTPGIFIGVGYSFATIRL